MKRLLIGFLGFLYVCLFVSAGFADITGPHNISHKRGVCANCHVPHKAKGDKIWSRPLSENFGGVRRLCNSCHDGTLSQSLNPDDPNAPGISSGIFTVFGTEFETHVMHGAADINNKESLGTYDREIFPLNADDTDNVPGHPEDWDKGGEGFYCGSCHNVHKQPQGNETDGDYLRTMPGKDIGKPGNRAFFCRQCHDTAKTGNAHFNSGNCQACHHPHEGKVKARADMTEEELMLARATFGAKVENVKFVAQPNVPEISEDPNHIATISSSLCYGCHQPHHILGPGDPNYNIWLESGAAPIYGDIVRDFIKNIDVDISNEAGALEHHPMGKEAKLDTRDFFLHAPGTDAIDHLNNSRELTCISCHADLHGNTEGMDTIKSKENNFLRWDFTEDNALFCLKCHIDKNMGSGENYLQIQEDGRHFWKTEPSISSQKKYRVVYDPVAPSYEKKIPCRQCMFCHFIHNGEERQSAIIPGVGIRADVDSLMRIEARNLAWGDRLADQDDNDYEDMCYGCHGDYQIVGIGCDGSLLRWEEGIYTHRFATAPDPNNNPSRVIKAGGEFPLADGSEEDEGESNTLNDYGTESGSIFCGTCHRVHDNTVSPYLNYTAGDTRISPYKPYGFCEYCHNTEINGSQFVHNSHPIEKAPNPPATVNAWPDIFYSGGSGCKEGVTYPGLSTGSIICLTCHNVHAASTSYNGRVFYGSGYSDPNSEVHGKLLVKDNFASKEGSDMCLDCHPF